MSSLATIWWSIWFFRNQRIFKNDKSSKYKIVEFIIRQHINWQAAKVVNKGISSFKTRQHSNEVRKKKNTKWEKPSRDTFKLNFDGSLRGNKSAATGYVIRDHDGNIISMKGESVSKSTVIGAEASAVRRGIIEAKRLRIRDISIEGDSLSVINALKGT